jgi:hypothetical protein
MTLFFSLRRWWNRSQSPRKTKPSRRRGPLHFEQLETRELLSGPSVSITALPFVAGNRPQIVVTASDTTAMTQVDVNVALDGSTTFAGAGDKNQTVQNISLPSGKATTITLNALPMPYRSSYLISATVLDAAGKSATSRSVTMQGPQADTVSLTVPATLTVSNENATIQVTAGKYDGLPATAYIDLQASNGTFQQLTSVALSSGKAIVPLSGLPAGSDKIRARIVDLAGNTDVSATQTVTVNGPTISITASPFTAVGKPQVIVTASDISPMTQVAIDVALDGSATFAGAGDLNQTVQTITLANNQPTTITLNAFPSPYLASYLIRARVLDSAGNQGTSNVATMQGPQADKVTLSVPATIAAGSNTATVQVAAGQYNSLPSTVYLDIKAGSGSFSPFANGTPSNSGTLSVPIAGLTAGTYQIRARTTDAAGNLDVSATQTITVGGPSVSITALPFAIGGKPQVVVTASDVNPMTQVDIDVALDGSSTFAGAGDLNQTVPTITLTNNQPTTITLNALPTPYLSSYLVRARVLDSLGNQGTSNVATMQGPQADKVTLSASGNVATVQVTAGQGNALPQTAYLDIASSNGTFTEYTSATLNSTGAATIPLAGLTSGTYQIRARIVDPAGDTDVSAVQSVTVSPPAVSITALPFVIGGKPQIVVTGSDVNSMTQVAIDVALDGSATFAGSGDLNQTVQTITLVSNQPTTITLNSFPTPYLSSYLVRARVVDSIGNQETSSVVTMQGPQPDTVTLTPSAYAGGSLAGGSLAAQVTAGQGNGYSSTVYLDVASNGAAFQQFTSATLSSTGTTNLSLIGLAAGTYQVRARVADLDGVMDVSPTQTITISSPQVSITALPFTVGGPAQVVVTASDINPITQVSIDVALDGNASFSGAGDVNQTVQTVTLTNNQPTIITLNALPTPYLSSYLVRARVDDSLGDVGTSSTVIIQGPQPDTVSLSVPATITSTSNTAYLQVTAGQNNGDPSSVTLAIDPNNGAFQTFTTATVGSNGAASIPLTGLPVGTYQIRASITDPAGNIVFSTPQTVTVSAPSANAAASSSATTTSTGINATPPANAGGSQGTPLSIIPNVGQVSIAPNVTRAPDIQFVVPIGQSSVLLSPNELDLVTPLTTSTGVQEQTTQSMVLVGASANAAGVGQDAQSSYSNIYAGSVSKSNVANYGQATFTNVYPGINLTYQGNTGTLEYSFTVSPGANLNAIALSFPGDSLSIDSSGDLVLTLPNGSTVTESAPVAYQTGADGVQQAVTCGFVINNGQVTFSVGTYNSTQPLVIDPYIFANFFNGIASAGSVAYANAMTVDSSGNIYLLANSDETLWAGTGTSLVGGRDAVVTKLSSDGEPIFTTYFGGPNDDQSNAIAVDAQGNIYVTGSTSSVAPYEYTNSASNPTVPAPFNVTSTLGTSVEPDAFVASLNSAGVGNQYTLFGGDLGDAVGKAIAVDGFGNIWVAGDVANPSGFTAGTVGGPFNVGTNGALNSALFLSKFAPQNISTSGYEYTDLYGNNSANTNVISMTIDGDNQIYVTGETNSGQAMPWSAAPAPYTIAIPRSQPYISTNPTSAEAGFLLQFQENAATFNVGGAAVPYAVITYGTYLGGSVPAGSDTYTTGVFAKDQNAVASRPNSGYVADVYLTGTTNSSNFFAQVSSGAVPVFPGLAGVNAIDYALELQIGPASSVPNSVQVAGTYIGSPASVSMGGGSIFVDSQGNVYVDGTLPAGESGSAFFDTNPIQPYTAGGNVNAFLTVLDPTMTDVLLGTTLGGTGTGEEEAVANLSSAGNFNPPNIPVFPGESLFVDQAGDIFVAGSTNLISPGGYQSVVLANGGSSQIFINPSTEGAFVAKISAVAPPKYGNDQFEPNDTSDLAANLDAYAATVPGIGVSYGPFPNLNTVRHVGGPVGDGLNYNGLFDYDWYQIIPTVTGALTVNLSGISVIASGPTGSGTTGDLDLYVYTVINGFLYLSGQSTLVNSSFQTVSINVTRGADILIDVNPDNYTQALYTMTATI